MIDNIKSVDAFFCHYCFSYPPKSQRKENKQGKYLENSQANKFYLFCVYFSINVLSF